MKSLLICLFLSLYSSTCFAMDAPPFEMFVRRAETVILAQVASIDGDTVTLRCTASLRGKTEVTNVLSLEWIVSPTRVGAEFLLLSQGDARYGSPPAVKVGDSLKGQGVWRGWLPIPIRKIGEQTYAEGVFSWTDGKCFTDGPPDDPDWKLSLPSTKRILDQTPYDPHVNDKA